MGGGEQHEIPLACRVLATQNSVKKYGHGLETGSHGQKWCFYQHSADIINL